MKKSQISGNLMKIRDHFSDVEKAVDLLYEVQQERGPVAEVVTVLKYEKPLLHNMLKTRLRNNPGLSLVFDLSMNYEQAKEIVYHS
jgi:hypothetical protein